MKPSILAVCALVLATFLSGCASGGGDATTSTTTQAATTSGETTSPETTSEATTSATTTTAAPNTPPVAKLAAANSRGPVPLQVNFTVEATDLEGDPLTFSLDFGDGTPPAEGDLPRAAPVSHNFTAQGNYTVVLTVSDGEASHATNITVAALSAAAPVPEATEYSCTVDLPLTGVVWPGSPAGNLGECTFTENDTSVVLATATPAGGCRIVFDADPSDTNAGSAASVGATYPAGGSFGMQCPPPSAGGEGKISLREADA